MDNLAPLLTKLSAASRRKYKNPYDSIVWPETLDRQQWFTSPELITLHDSLIYDSLDEQQRQLLSFFEAVNFFSLNIHGEKALMEGIVERLYAPHLSALSDYLHHFLDEENKHSIWFGTFCMKYAGKIYPDRKIEFPRDYVQGEEDFLFFARVVIFEEIVDRFNVLMGNDDRLAPLIAKINLNHHQDESRHLSFGRNVVAELWNQHSPSWTVEKIREVQSYIENYFTSVWREYYNPTMYVDAGLPDARTLAGDTYSSETAQNFRRDISAKCIEYYLENNILEKEPEL